MLVVLLAAVWRAELRQMLSNRQYMQDPVMVRRMLFMLLPRKLSISPCIQPIR